MATRAVIGKLDTKEQKVEYIYLHFDGYPEWAGKKLNSDYWRDVKNVENLIKAGDLIALYETLSDSKFYKNECDFKEADLDNFKARCITLKQWDDSHFAFGNIEYSYLFDLETKQWTCNFIQ